MRPFLFFLMCTAFLVSSFQQADALTPNWLNDVDGSYPKSTPTMAPKPAKMESSTHSAPSTPAVRSSSSLDFGWLNEVHGSYGHGASHGTQNQMTTAHTPETKAVVTPAKHSSGSIQDWLKEVHGSYSH